MSSPRTKPLDASSPVYPSSRADTSAHAGCFRGRSSGAAPDRRRSNRTDTFGNSVLGKPLVRPFQSILSSEDSREEPAFAEYRRLAPPESTGMFLSAFMNAIKPRDSKR